MLQFEPVFGGEAAEGWEALLLALRSSMAFTPVAMLLERYPHFWNLGLEYFAVTDAAAAPEPSADRVPARSAQPLRLRRFLFRYGSEFLGLFVGLYVLLWALAGLGFVAFPAALTPLAAPLHLASSWGMYSPPPRSDHYHLFPGLLSDGSMIDLARDRNFGSWEVLPYEDIPFPNIREYYVSHRFNKYFEGISFGEEDYKRDVRLALGRWICREFWDRWRYEDPAVRLVELAVLNIQREARPPSFQLGSRSHSVMLHYRCGEAGRTAEETKADSEFFFATLNEFAKRRLSDDKSIFRQAGFESEQEKRAA
jgi:hypothetical protein